MQFFVTFLCLSEFMCCFVCCCFQTCLSEQFRWLYNVTMYVVVASLSQGLEMTYLLEYNSGLYMGTGRGLYPKVSLMPAFSQIRFPIIQQYGNSSCKQFGKKRFWWDFLCQNWENNAIISTREVTMWQYHPLWYNSLLHGIWTLAHGQTV